MCNIDGFSFAQPVINGTIKVIDSKATKWYFKRRAPIVPGIKANTTPKEISYRKKKKKLSQNALEEFFGEIYRTEILNETQLRDKVRGSYL